MMCSTHVVSVNPFSSEEGLLHKLLQQKSFPQAAIPHTLLQHVSLPQDAVLQKLFQQQVSHRVTSPVSKYVPAWAPLSMGNLWKILSMENIISLWEDIVILSVQ